VKRIRVFVLIAMISTLALAASAPASSSHGTLVKLHGTKLGKLLVGRSGHLLYVFAPDKRGQDVCIRKPGCTRVWPPLTTAATPVASNGVNSRLLGTIGLPSGKKQLTYAGHPLYNWTQDPGGGDTVYVGINATGGKWYAINAAGHVVKG
jgi:predicted lipoprotein with Yx(FWY)xxD motif